MLTPSQITLCSLNGVTGTWGRGTNGIGRFFFDPDSVTTFTVEMNAYSANVEGDHYVYAVYVADISSGFNAISRFHLIWWSKAPLRHVTS